MEYMAQKMDDHITSCILAEEAEIERLKLCERRLAAVTVWLEKNQPDVFSRGLWDAVNEA